MERVAAVRLFSIGKKYTFSDIFHFFYEEGH